MRLLKINKLSLAIIRVNITAGAGLAFEDEHMIVLGHERPRPRIFLMHYQGADRSANQNVLWSEK